MSRAGILVVAGGALLVAVGLTLGQVGEEPGALPNWQALILGIIAGATELLPISSSGHLILVPWLGGWEYLEQNDEFNQTFDVALHVGTLVAVVSYFWTDVEAPGRRLDRQRPPAADRDARRADRLVRRRRDGSRGA